MKTKLVRHTLDTLPPLTDARRERLTALSKRTDSEIDTSDIPEMTDEQWKTAVRRNLYRPVKQQITARIDADVLDWLKSQGKGYQSRINGILRQEMYLERKGEVSHVLENKPQQTSDRISRMPLPKPFDLFSVFAKFGAERGIPINNPATSSAFISHTSEAIQSALSDPLLLHGQRTEHMFEALVATLDEAELLKKEDAGPFHSKGNYRVPDFRLVLNDGVQWLVEVKNVYIEEALEQKKRIMTKGYHEEMAAYAALTGAALKIAIYWARWRIWTLISPEKLLDAEGNLDLEMTQAMRFNEMGTLGDRMVGTTPPLRLQFVIDPNKPRKIGKDGKTKLTIDHVKLFSDQRELVEAIDQKLFYLFIEFGEWEEKEPIAITSGDSVDALEFRWEPRQRGDQNFEIIGTLSRMFSSYYAEHTIKNNAVVQLQAPIRPGWFAPLVSYEKRGANLPLWTFILEPPTSSEGREPA